MGKLQSIAHGCGQILLHIRGNQPPSRMKFVNPLLNEMLNNVWAEWIFLGPKAFSLRHYWSLLEESSYILCKSWWIHPLYIREVWQSYTLSFCPNIRCWFSESCCDPLEPFVHLWSKNLIIFQLWSFNHYSSHYPMIFTQIGEHHILPCVVIGLEIQNAAVSFYVHGFCYGLLQAF